MSTSLRDLVLWAWNAPLWQFVLLLLGIFVIYAATVLVFGLAIIVWQQRNAR